MRRLALFILTVSFVSTAAFAQATSPSAGSGEGRKVKAGKTTYDFDEVDIMGQVKRPDTGEVTELPEYRFKRLLDLDESFVPEIVRAVDEF